MQDNISNLILEHLRVIRGDVADLKHGMREITVRIGQLEVRMGDVERTVAQ